MAWWAWTLVGLGAVAALWAALLAGLLIAGRPSDARALVRFVPDCAVLLRRLLADPRVPRRHKVLLGALLAYLVSPLDLVPDVIPVVGQLDDAIVIGLTLRVVVRGAGVDVVREHWPGPPASLEPLLRLAYGRAAAMERRTER